MSELITYNGTIVMLGYGVVAQCTLPILFRHIKPANKIIILDKLDNSKNIPADLKNKVEFHRAEITRENYDALLSRYLKSGDLLLDLAYDVDCMAMLEWCHAHDVMYLNTSVEEWNPYADAENKSPLERTLYARHMEIRAMIAKRPNKKGITAVVDHGANPGLISHLAKKGLADIMDKLIVEKPTDDRVNDLKKARKENDFAKISYLLGVKVIHVSERDTQAPSTPRRSNEFVNTWSIAGLLEEGTAPSELGWGTHEKTLPANALTHSTGPKNQICLTQMGVDTWVRSWVPSGDIHGMVIRHGESFTMSDHLTHHENGEAIYRPTVHYAYLPSDSTINSLLELKIRNLKPQAEQRIMRDEIVSGGVDELGALLMGHDYNGWWTGTILSIDEARTLIPNQNATTMQVAAGLLGALIWMLKNPQEGVCVPDNLPYDQVLAVAAPYLGLVASQQTDWNPLKNRNNLFVKFNDRSKTAKLDAADMWQFSTFLIDGLD